jgi:hypothetical protein
MYIGSVVRYNEMITFLLSVSIICLLSVCTIAWGKYLTKEKELKNEIWKRDVLLNHGEVPRAIWHNEQKREFIQNSINKTKEAILFCDAGGNDLSKLKVEFPDLKKVNCDVSTNLFHIWKPNEIYPTQELFIEALKMFIPAEKLEVVNGFMNITFPAWLHSYSIHRIIFNT